MSPRDKRSATKLVRSAKPEEKMEVSKGEVQRLLKRALRLLATHPDAATSERAQELLTRMNEQVKSLARRSNRDG
jgi:hypothetical protein